MFRFGKHRKDGVAPTETVSDLGPLHMQSAAGPLPLYGGVGLQMQQDNLQKLALHQAHALNDRPPGGPPTYQPPPPVINGGVAAIHQNDVFNQRYSHYANYDELQQQQQQLG